MGQRSGHDNHTYADYRQYPENERIELIDGKIYAMAPAPSRVHQEIVAQVTAVLINYINIKKGKCKVYPALFDVILNTKDDADSSSNM